MPASKPSINIVAVGFMLFALFFGAGNLIFPPMLGQMSGENVFSANLGFIVTGVGLPILAILALAFSGKNDLQSLASRVHPAYGVFFTVALYLTIGPFFAIPRTNTVAFEIGMVPFIGDVNTSLWLLLFTILFFGATLFFSLKAQKIVDIVGKILTPVLLIAMLVLIVAFFISPIGSAQPPTEDYMEHSFFVGFQEGYLTMDALAAFVFGIIIINIIKEAGATTKREIMNLGWKIAVIAGILLAFIYSSLAYLGAGGVEELGYLDNGGAILAAASNYYFGNFGGVILAIIVILACLTTSIGLITSCASYFTKLIPSLSYTAWAVIFTLVSAVIANFGLNAIIEFSVPVLVALYPLAMALLVLTFLHPIYQGRKEVYQFSILLTLVVSVLDGLNAAGVNMPTLNDFVSSIIPWYTIGLGWVIPMLVGGILGFIISIMKSPRPQREA